MSGLGVGLLVEPTDSSRGARLGTFVGTAAGLGMGALVLPRLALDDQKAAITGLAAGAVGGWTGAWLPFLGHASSDDVEGKRIAGGLMAGAGLATAAGLLAEPVLDPNPDLVGNALAIDALFTGAGAGVGALVSTRDDAPVWGMLGAESAGLVLGGALHESIRIDEADAPLLALATGEGLWLGAWLPAALYGPENVTGRRRAGGLLAGGAGALGLAAISSGKLRSPPPPPDTPRSRAGSARRWAAASRSCRPRFTIGGASASCWAEPHSVSGSGRRSRRGFRWRRQPRSSGRRSRVERSG